MSGNKQDFDNQNDDSQNFDDENQNQDQDQEYDSQDDDSQNNGDFDGDQDDDNDDDNNDGNEDDDDDGDDEDDVDGPKYIRLRGLPWSATHKEILDFLKDIEVVGNAEGIHIVTRHWDGKNTGEAYVEVKTQEDVATALKLDNASIGNRYIEVFHASSKEAKETIRKTTSHGTSYIVKLRGLPYSVTEHQVEEFFSGLEIKADREGIVFVMDRRGRATGEAFVQFESQEDTEQALGRNRQKIGHRYIEIFRSSMAEMKRSTGNSNGRMVPYDLKDRGSNRGGGSGSDYGGNNRNNRWGNGGFGVGANNSLGVNNIPSFGNNGIGCNDGGMGNFGNNGGGNFGNFANNAGGNNFGNNAGGGGGNNVFNRFSGNSGNFGNDFGDFGNVGNDRGSNNVMGNNNNGSGFNNFTNFGNCGGNNMGGGGGFGNNMVGGRKDDFYMILMRGLPFSSFKNDVYKFFEPLRPASVHIHYNKQDRHNGTAEALFETKEDVQSAMKRHRCKMGQRYIELFFNGTKSKTLGKHRICIPK